MCFQAVVLEGKYWKRRLESVTSEYKKWRLFFRDRFLQIPKKEEKTVEVEINRQAFDCTEDIL